MTATYPNLLAAGVTDLGRLDQFQLYAGDTDVITQDGTAADATLIEQFRVVGMNAANKIVPWNPTGVGTVGQAYATGALTYSGTGTAADTVTIGTTVITLVAAGAVGNQYNIGATAIATAQNLKAFVNANTEALGVNASGDAAVITLEANTPGTAANAIATTEAGSETSFGAATLAGGTNVTAPLPESRAIGFAMQGVPATTPGVSLPYAVQGMFNPAALVWPEGIVDINAQKAAFAGTAVAVRQLL
jgi:hypothetical protein